MRVMNTIHILKTIANPQRFQLLQWLKEPEKYFSQQGCGAEPQEVCVGLIEQKLGLSQSTTSKYLSQLQQAGLVSSRRHGQWTYYRYNPQAMKQLLQALKQTI